MSRLLFRKGQQKEFIDNIQRKSGLSLKMLGKICRRNSKNLSDWHLEKSTIPYKDVLILSKKFLIKIPDDCKIVSDFWYTSRAGKIGGITKIKKYGNPGTSEGRKLGGIKSQNTHKELNTNFKRREKVKIPKKSEDLAEFFGIMLGDGGISKHQITITLSNLVDVEYSFWMIDFIKRLFKIQASRKEGKRNNIRITISRTSLADFLIKSHLPSGNKIKHQIDIPGWITKNKKFSASCVRGLIDTDGCIYIDKHNYKNKVYKNICLDFTSASKNLLNSVYQIFTNLELEPKKYEKSIKIRKRKNVIKYFKIIGPHNIKHINKLQKFLKGEVA